MDMDMDMDFNQAQDHGSSYSADNENSDADTNALLKAAPTGGGRGGGTLRRSTRLARRTRAYFESEEFQSKVPDYYLESGERDINWCPGEGILESDLGTDGGSDGGGNGELEQEGAGAGAGGSKGLDRAGVGAGANTEAKTPSFWIVIPPWPPRSGVGSSLPLSSPTHDVDYNSHGDSESNIMDSPSSQSYKLNKNNNGNRSKISNIIMKMDPEPGAPSPQASDRSDEGVQGRSIAQNMAIWGSVEYLGLEGQWDKVAFALGLRPIPRVVQQLEDEYNRLRELKDSGLLFNGLE
ncbi:hypothetical protein BGZ95_002712 [Linnemannia exigua]|uniref:Uncharacterized protein n=1 Tax=Linnemannia exigua TaxID=604196 RepID=A0AAD4DKI4_9FUNG|nr:hypothetical protein BGZ95_002712 [Linnemannia exigua]